MQPATLPQNCILRVNAGHEKIDEVLAVVFDYVGAVLREAPTEELLRDVWRENADLGRLRFRFAERLQPFTAAESLAHGMQDYPEKCARRPPVDALYCQYTTAMPQSCLCRSRASSSILLASLRLVFHIISDGSLYPTRVMLDFVLVSDGATSIHRVNSAMLR